MWRVLVAVLVIDCVLLFFAGSDVDQTGVARAYRDYVENPTEENLRIRKERFAAASRQQARNRGFGLLGILFVTSSGAFVVGRQFERQHPKRRDATVLENGTPTI
jgi:hypothetical protein